MCFFNSMRQLRRIMSIVLWCGILSPFAIISAADECATTVPTGAEEKAFLFIPHEVLAEYTPQTERHIGVAMHVVRKSDGSGGISTADMNTALEDLNTQFAAAMIVFNQVSVDYISNDTYYDLNIANRFSLWQINRNSGAINIYFVNDLFNTAGDHYNGVAELPGNALAVTKSAAVNSSTLAHEVGHNFYLLHTHETAFGAECINGSNCSTAGDLLCDTPADPKLSERVFGNCGYISSPLPPADPCGNNNYSPDTGNLMSYSLPHCRDSFSDQQIQRMHNALENQLSYLIDFTAILANRIGGSNISGSTLSLDGSVIQSGNTVTLLEGKEHEGKTNHERFLNYPGQGNIKHHDWNVNGSEFRLVENFIGDPAIPFQDANFGPVVSVTVTNRLLSYNNNPGGEMDFKDPWYLASDETQPDIFIGYAPPLTPTGAYNQSTGGVFLNQPYTGINPVYYSVQAIDAQQLTVNSKATIWDWAGWKYDPLEIDLESPTSKTTAVVFKTADATLTANMKGRRISDKPEATFANNSSKLTRHWADAITQKPWLVYEDRGNIYTAEQDAGSNWLKDVRIAAASSSTSHHHPAVSYLYEVSGSQSDQRVVVWESLDINNGTYDLNTTMGSPGDWSAPDEPLHASVAGYRQFTAPSQTENAYSTAAVAFRGGGIIPKASTETSSGISLWFTYDNYTANVTANSSADFPTIDNREYPTTLNFREPHYMLAWHENTGIQYREVERRNDQGAPGYSGATLLNSGIQDLTNNLYPSIHTAGTYNDGKERVYVVWQGLDEWTPQEKTGEKARSQTTVLCDAQTLDTPVICFRERQSSGWQPLVMFGVSNYCDRKPVVTSWTAGSDRNVMMPMKVRKARPIMSGAITGNGRMRRS